MNWQRGASALIFASVPVQTRNAQIGYHTRSPQKVSKTSILRIGIVRFGVPGMFRKFFPVVLHTVPLQHCLRYTDTTGRRYDHSMENLTISICVHLILGLVSAQTMPKSVTPHDRPKRCPKRRSFVLEPYAFWCRLRFGNSVRP